MKDPTDVLDYRFDIGPALVGNDGDAIATIDVTIAPADPGDLTVNSVKADGNIAVLWLSAGQTGVVYTIVMTITTLNGRYNKPRGYTACSLSFSWSKLAECFDYRWRTNHHGRKWQSDCSLIVPPLVTIGRI